MADPSSRFGSGCTCCGRFFRPHPRLGRRQRTCGRPACRRGNKRLQEQRWRRANPGYFDGRYETTKAWRAAHPGYQRAWRARHRGEIQTLIRPQPRLQSVRLQLRAPPPLGEIQTLILRLRPSGSGLWVDGAQMQAA
jgi:hypothetical protein